MDSGGLDALSAVQGRIAEIQSRFSQLTGGGAGGVLGAPSTTDATATGADSTGSSSDFASALASATTDASMAGPAPSDSAIPADGDMRSLAARTKFAHDVLGRIGAPVTTENMRALVAWQAAEGTRAAFNPLATCRSSQQPGESQFNSVGVKNFPTYEAGLDTTVAALQNGLYGNVLAALQRGNSAQAVAQAVASSRWGTGQGVLRALAATPA
jgi:hypothetical protein